ncbi:Rhodanese-like domain-containing protein, partial [Usnea florida]
SPSPPKPYTFTDIQHLTASPSPTRLIIDVREPAELRQTGKIPGALSMPLTSNPDAFYLDGGAFFERFGFEKPRAREVIFYCKAGVRSRAAARMAREWVGVRAGDMKGGWMEWEAKGGE